MKKDSRMEGNLVRTGVNSRHELVIRLPPHFVVGVEL